MPVIFARFSGAFTAAPASEPSAAAVDVRTRVRCAVPTRTRGAVDGAKAFPDALKNTKPPMAAAFRTRFMLQGLGFGLLRVDEANRCAGLAAPAALACVATGD